LEEKFIEKKILENYKNLKKCISFPSIDLIFLEFKNKKKANEVFCKFEKFVKKNNNFLEWAPLNCIQKTTTLDFCVLNNEVMEYKHRFIPEKKGKKISLISKKEGGFFVLKKGSGKLTRYPKKEIVFPLSEKEIPVKLLIRNVPFQAKLWDLRKIFVNFGKLISIRMPKKKDGSFRGFAFVVFSSLENAKKALLISQSVHLFSRRLIPSIIE